MPVARTAILLCRPLVRAIYWTPVLGTAVLMPALVLTAVLAVPAIPGDVALNLLRAAALLIAAGAAYCLADDMDSSTAALPTPRWVRQWLRTAFAAVPATVGWGVVYAIVSSRTPPRAALPLAGAAIEAGVAMALAMAGAAIAVRHIPGRHGAVAGGATLFGAFIGSLFLSGTWSPWTLPNDPRWDTTRTWWLATLVVAFAVVALAHRDNRR